MSRTSTSEVLMRVEFTVNGSRFEVDVPPGEVLLDTLRGLGFRGVKDGCRVSDCGTCTVLLDGRPVPSCTVLTGPRRGQRRDDDRGLGDAESPHPLQTEFLARGAAQCAYCMQGMIVSAKALLDENPHPSRDEIREGLSGNLCRCTGYVKAVEAVEAVAAGATGGAPSAGATPATGAGPPRPRGPARSFRRSRASATALSAGACRRPRG